MNLGQTQNSIHSQENFSVVIPLDDAQIIYDLIYDALEVNREQARVYSGYPDEKEYNYKVKEASRLLKELRDTMPGA